MKLNKRLSAQQFISSQFIILTAGLAFLFGIFYILNIQYQKSTTPFSNGPVTTLTKTLRMDLTQPDDDNLVFQSPILVSGKTTPQSEVLIFTEFQNLIVKSKNDGSFSVTLDLMEGENKITAVVFDQIGDSRSAEKTVFYSKEQI